MDISSSSCSKIKSFQKTNPNTSVNFVGIQVKAHVLGQPPRQEQLDPVEGPDVADDAQVLIQALEPLVPGVDLEKSTTNGFIL